jgi:hypothetical protein
MHSLRVADAARLLAQDDQVLSALSFVIDQLLTTLRLSFVYAISVSDALSASGRLRPAARTVWARERDRLTLFGHKFLGVSESHADSSQIGLVGKPTGFPSRMSAESPFVPN